MMVLKQIFTHTYPIFTLFFIKSNKSLSIDVIRGLAVKSSFIIITIRLEIKKDFEIYDVNTGKPIVAVVINAPAKIKKGR